MGNILDKLSSYNIFNYLLPGTLFAVIGDTFSSYSFIQSDVLVAVFAYYFFGLVISRIGSLFVEPVLKKVGVIKFVGYENYVIASKSDEKLDQLSEVNNMYRTLCSLFIFLALLVTVDVLAETFDILRALLPYLTIAGLFALFLLSYRKQTQFIVKRVNTDSSSKK